MDPDGNYAGRLSYTAITSSDNKVDALVDASNDPADAENEDKRSGLGASAPPLSQLSIVANGEVCETSPDVKKEAKSLSPPDEPTLNSVVVPIGPGTVDAAQTRASGERRRDRLSGAHGLLRSGPWGLRRPQRPW